MKFIIALLITFTVSVASAEEHKDHSKHSSAKSAKHNTAAKKFVPTEDLKVRMEKILALMKTLNDKKDKSKNLKDSGVKLENIVDDIFKTCKLAPEADEAVHPALALILDGADEFKKGKYDSGHKKIHEGLLDYEKSFSHKGWKH